MISLRTKVLAAAVMVSGTLAIGVGGTLMGQTRTAKPAPTKVSEEARPAEPAPATQPPSAAGPAPMIIATPTNSPTATAPATSPNTKSVSSSRSTSSQPTWEYKIVREDIRNITEEQFNTLGKDHWEFCATMPGNPGQILFKRQQGNTAVAIGVVASGSGDGVAMGAPGGAVDIVPSKPKPRDMVRIPLKHADATEVVQIVQLMFDTAPPGVSEDRSKQSPKLLANQRTNTVIVVGLRAEIDSVAMQILKLDEISRSEKLDKEKEKRATKP